MILPPMAPGSTQAPRFALRSIDRQTLIAGLAVLAIGIWLRSATIGRESLWLDEIYSVSLANLSIPGTLMAVLHFDVHPPLYYLQLNLWERMGHSDVWVLLNSVFWSAATLCAVFAGSSREFGARAGLLALVFCAVMGSEIFFADELRMYALMGCLTVLCWIAANRLLRQYSLRRASSLIVLLALLAAVHSAALIPASAVMLYILPAATAPTFRRDIRTWLAIATLVACAYAPWMLLARMHHVEHAAAPSLHALTQTVGGWILGYGAAPMPAWALPAAATLVTVALAITIAAAPQLLRLVACFIVWPLVFGAILCLVVQPIWLDRTFSFCAPFLAIACGASISTALSRPDAADPSHRSARWPVQALVTLWLAGGAWIGYEQVTSPYKPDDYRDGAAYLNINAKPGDTLFAPDDPDFWGIARYMIGPQWGSILTVEDQGDKDRKFRLLNWLETHAHLSRRRLQEMGLASETRQIDNGGRHFFIGDSPLPSAAATDVVWLVTRDGDDFGDLQSCSSNHPNAIAFGRVQVYRLECSAPRTPVAVSANGRS